MQQKNGLISATTEKSHLRVATAEGMWVAAAVVTASSNSRKPAPNCFPRPSVRMKCSLIHT
jgi:hypothetical protein